MIDLKVKRTFVGNKKFEEIFSEYVESVIKGLEEIDDNNSCENSDVGIKEVA